MANLTKEQARALADQFEACATAINTYRNDNAAILSPQNKASLDRDVATLINRSAELDRLAATIVLNDLEQSLADIKTATSGIEAALKKIETAGKCINYASKLVVLAGAICTGNGVTIATTTAGIISSLREDAAVS